MKKYCVITYGCQMNLHESEKIAGILTSMGYEKSDDEHSADVIVFNTCCIRENAEERAEGNIGALKSLKKKNKDIIIAVGGCMTQQPEKAEELRRKFPFVDIIFGTHNLDSFGDMLSEKLSDMKRKIVSVDKTEGAITEGTPKTRTSYPNAWVNVTYGCNNFCSYCIVPYVRGRERSRLPEDVVKECEKLVSEGYKEITLLGQNVNSYGAGTDTDFADLLKKIDAIDGKFRLRFMTNHPKDLSEKLMKVIAESNKICHSIHLPVQSGSNRILKLMNRKYTRERYFELTDKLRSYVPDVAITTDVMVGFPTETEEDFDDTFDLMKRVGFSGAFTFIYSKRSGTPASTMDGQVDEAVAKKRIMKLIALQNAENRKKSAEYKGKTIEILCEGYDEKKDCFLGRDEYGRMAYFKGDASLIGQFVNVKITKTGGISLIGEIVN